MDVFKNLLLHFIQRLFAYFLLMFIFMSPYFIEQCLALYEDQVGKFDWRQQYIGAVKFVHFDYSSNSRKIIVASEQNVIAAINPSTSQIVWRQILEQSAVGTIHVIAGTTGEIISVTGFEALVRSWDTATGRLNWETLLLRTNEDSGTTKLEEPDATYYGIDVVDRSVIVVDCWYSRFLQIKRYNFVTGKMLQTMKVSASWFNTWSSCQIISTTHFVCSNRQVLGKLFWLLLNGGTEFSTTTVPGLIASQDYVNVEVLPLFPSDLNQQNLFAVRLGSSRFIALRAVESRLEIVGDFQQVLRIRAAQVKNDTFIVLLSKSVDSDMVVKSFHVESKAYVEDMESSVSYPNHHGAPDRMFVHVVPKRDGGYGYRLLMTTEAHSLILIQQPGRAVWIREEALASVINVEMVDLPVSESDARVEEQFENAHDSVVTMMVKRLLTQASQLRNFLMRLLLGLRSDVTGTPISDSALELVRDEFNIHKVAVLVTSVGKIYGLDSLSGTILWQRYLPELRSFGRFDQNRLPVYVLRTTAHHPHEPRCAILGMDKEAKRSMLFVFNPISGNTVEQLLHRDFEIIQAMQLPHPDAEFLRGLLFIDRDYKVHVYPKSAYNVALKFASFLYMFVADADSGDVHGLSLRFSTTTELVAGIVWSMSFPRQLSTITNIIMRRGIEHVHSQGRVMSDRSVLYKYLNPNLAVITTEEATEDGKTLSKSTSVSVYLVDVVSGHVVFSAIHKRAKGPVHVVYSENWIVYVLNNEKSRRTEAIVLELYEGKTQSNTTAFSSLSQPPNPMIERQAYIVPVAMDAVAVTITDKGITSKHLLFALSMGGILEMPKALLDPRRSLFPSQEQREEGIMPYNPELPIPTEQIINYNQSVFRIRGIYTAPTGLESTSLVLAYGLDMYYTRVTPSRTFDILKDDFDHWLIVAVLSALILASYGTRVLAARKALKQAWK